MRRGRALGLLALTVGLLAAAVVVVVLTRPGPAPSVDERLERRIERLGIPLYLPELRGGELPREVRVQDGRLAAAMWDAEGEYVYSLGQQRAPEGDLCRALGLDDEPYPCESDDDTLRFTFEEMSQVAVRRGDVLLTAGSLVTESDLTLLEEAIGALRDAEETDAAWFARRRPDPAG